VAARAVNSPWSLVTVGGGRLGCVLHGFPFGEGLDLVQRVFVEMAALFE